MEKFSKLSFISFYATILIRAEIPETFYSVQTHFGQYYRADMDSASVVQMLDMVQQAGISCIRDECYWSLIEQDSGVYDFPKEIDHYVQAALNRGIEILMILDYNNSIYDGGSSAVSTDSNRQAYARYCQATVRHYSLMGVKYYEIWNEPNIPIFWSPEPNADDYFELLKVAYPAIKAIDSTVEVLGCATSPSEGDPAPNIKGLTFIQRVFQLGGKDYMDAVSFHLYRVWQKPEDWMHSYSNSVKAIVGDDFPSYLSEIGYPIFSGWFNVDLQKQARYITRTYLLGRSVENLKMIDWYDLKNDGEVVNEPEHNFGILYYNRSPKPAYNSIKQLINFTGSRYLIDAVSVDDSYQYIFADTTDTIQVIWNATATVSMEASVPKGRLIALGIFGDTLNFYYNKDGGIKATHSMEPRYILPIDRFPAIESMELLHPLDTLVVGQSYSLNLVGYTIDGKVIIIDDGSCIQWESTSNIAEIDSNGLVTAWNIGTTTLSGQFEEYVFEKIFTILPSYNYLELESFDLLDRLNFTLSYVDTVTRFTVINSASTTPPNAMAVNYTIKYRSRTGHKIYIDCDYPMVGEPDSILIDVYNNGNNHYLKFYMQDRDCREYMEKTDYFLDQDSWQTVGAELDKMNGSYFYPLRLKKILLYVVEDDGIVDSIYTGTLLFDNLRIHSVRKSDIETKDFNVPDLIALHQNYPNPFNSTTTIYYDLPKSVNIQIGILDLRGEIIKHLVNKRQSPGQYSFHWDGTDETGKPVASGVYFCSMVTEGYMKTTKMLLVK